MYNTIVGVGTHYASGLLNISSFKINRISFCFFFYLHFAETMLAFRVMDILPQGKCSTIKYTENV